MPGCIGRTGCDLSNAWIWDFSSTHSTIARSGGSRYRPTTSRTLSTNSGSVDSLNDSDRHGCRPNVRQIRDTVDCDIPVALAIDRLDQWVALRGLDSSVSTITRSTSASVTVRGRPGRASSYRPSTRWATNRDRHVPTVGSDTPNSRDTSLLDRPSAQASTIRARIANACAVVRLRVNA